VKSVGRLTGKVVADEGKAALGEKFRDKGCRVSPSENAKRREDTEGT